MKSSNNSSIRVPFVVFLLTISLLVPALAAEKKSLREAAQQIKDPEVIAELFGAAEPLSKEQSKKRKKLFKDNESNLQALLADFDASVNFHRGEIEDEKTLNGLINYLQLSVLKMRSLADENKKKSWQQLEDILKSWLQFSADFPYEEASLVGLRSISVVRSFLLDELEKMQEKYQADIAKNDYLRIQMMAIRSPWPIDRVVMTEAKKVLRTTPMQVAEKLAKDLQKNPYQTSEAGLKKLKGGSAKELEFLKEIWREKDIDLMKTEVNRIGEMKLKLAAGVFAAKFGKQPATVPELVSAGYLDRVPLNYKTGKPMELNTPHKSP